MRVMLTGSYPPRVCGIADYTSCVVDRLPMPVWTRTTCATRPEAVGVADDFGPTGLEKLLEKLRAERPSLVHLQYERAIWDQNPDVCVKLPAEIKKVGARLVTTLHSLDGPVGWGKFHRLALVPLIQKSDAVLVCSHRQLSLLGRVPGLAHKLTLTPVGNVIPVTGVRHELPPDEPLRLVYFGFLWKGRNVEALLRALKAVRASGLDATLTLVGEVREPEYRASLEALASELGVAGRVVFTGALPPEKISQELADADLCLLPFATGVSTGRTTLFAALAHGAPIVTMATPENLAPEFRAGENLLLTPVGDEAGYIAEVVRAARDPELRTTLRAGARALASGYAWQALAAHLEKTYGGRV
jgi:polysaccharide biosynthesis protein PslF